MEIMFMGTPDFAVESMNALKEAGHNIKAVVTMPDKPKGRGHKLAHTPVYIAAEKLGAEILTPQNLKKENFEEVLLRINPDIIVVVAYGKILPEYILNYPKFGCINVHASLLPQYRGAAPIQRAIIDGCQTTGVTTMYMEKGLDTGDMLMKSEVSINDDDNFETLHDKLSSAGAHLIVQTLSSIECGQCKPEKQCDEESTYASMITKDTAKIDWNKNARNIVNLIRGLDPVPRAQSLYKSRLVKFGKAVINDDVCDEIPGTVVSVDKDSFTVACGDKSSIRIYELQMEGKKMLGVSEYLKGNSIDKDVILGS